MLKKVVGMEKRQLAWQRGNRSASEARLAKKTRKIEDFLSFMEDWVMKNRRGLVVNKDIINLTKRGERNAAHR